MIGNNIKNNQIQDEVDTKHAPQIPKSALKKIFNSIAKIKINFGKKEFYGTAFFLRTKIKNEDYYFLVTNYHIIGQDQVNSKALITIYYGDKNNKKEKLINLDRKRFIKCYDKPIDITIIEIDENDNIPKDKYFFRI